MKRASTLMLCGALLGVALIATSANAQAAGAARTFVSGTGTDSGSCTVTAPCRSFAYAITQTAAAGEITVLSSAGYGAVTITGSVTITNPGGVEAGVTATSGTSAITIATSSSSTVTLRGLTLEGGGVGSHGIAATAGAGGTLNIIDVVAKDFTGSGIAVAPSSGTTNVLIADSFALNNGQSGISLNPTGTAAVQFTIARTVASSNVYGLNLQASASGSRIDGLVVDSHADSNSNTGIAVTGSGPNAPGCVSSNSSTNAYVVVQNSSAVNNQLAGIEATGTAINSNGPFPGSGVVITGSTFINDGNGDLYGNCGMIFSAGDNIYFLTEVGQYGGGTGSFGKH